MQFTVENIFLSKKHFTLKQMQPYPLFALGDLGRMEKGSRKIRRKWGRKGCLVGRGKKGKGGGGGARGFLP